MMNTSIIAMNIMHMRIMHMNITGTAITAMKVTATTIPWRRKRHMSILTPTLTDAG